MRTRFQWGGGKPRAVHALRCGRSGSTRPQLRLCPSMRGTRAENVASTMSTAPCGSQVIQMSAMAPHSTCRAPHPAAHVATVPAPLCDAAVQASRKCGDTPAFPAWGQPLSSRWTASLRTGSVTLGAMEWPAGHQNGWTRDRSARRNGASRGRMWPCARRAASSGPHLLLSPVASRCTVPGTLSISEERGGACRSATLRRDAAEGRRDGTFAFTRHESRAHRAATSLRRHAAPCPCRLRDHSLLGPGPALLDDGPGSDRQWRVRRKCGAKHAFAAWTGARHGVVAPDRNGEGAGA